METKNEKTVQRIPKWIKFTVPSGETYLKVKRAINSRNLNTVCLQAKCPNIGECLCNGTATFMIMGDNCTRNCLYCAVSHDKPQVLNAKEPQLIADAIKELELEYAVITSVTRDDLDDGGASHFAKTINAIKESSPNCGVEVLVPDFKKSMKKSADLIFSANPEVFNHNIEVVKRIFPKVRAGGDFEKSLELLNYASLNKMKVKSGLMVGLGETTTEIFSTLQELKSAGVQIITIGQYLRATKENIKVEHYYTPDDFKEIKKEAEKMGFQKVIAAPMARSSYHAKESSRE